MMVPIFFVLLSILCPYVVHSASSKLQWAPDEYFSPVSQATKCGHQSDRVSYVCDPNGLLGEHLPSFDWVLRDAAYNSTKCPCSNYHCETFRGAKGYRIGVALVRQMKLEKGSDGKRNTLSDQAQLFAYHLNKKWNLGQCEEDIIIFYSKEDKTLAIYGGSTANLKLTPYYRNLLKYRTGSRFEDGRLVEALNNLIFDLKVVLNCDSDDPRIDCGLHELRAGAAGFGVSVATVMAALMVSLGRHLM